MRSLLVGSIGFARGRSALGSLAFGFYRKMSVTPLFGYWCEGAVTGGVVGVQVVPENCGWGGHRKEVRLTKMSPASGSHRKDGHMPERGSTWRHVRGRTERDTRGWRFQCRG